MRNCYACAVPVWSEMRGTATHARNCALPEEMIHDLEPADGGLDEEEDIGGTEGEQLGIALRHSVGVRHQLHCTHTEQESSPTPDQHQ